MGIIHGKAQVPVMKKQNLTIAADTCYTIGNYQICPREKKVKVYTMTGGIDWDGYTYLPLDNIDFENTEMYLIGNSVIFKEQTKGRDLKKAHFIYPEKFRLNDSGIPLFAFDNDSVFEESHLTIYSLISTQDKTYSGNYLFEDKDQKLYTLVNYGRTFSPELPDSLGIDRATLKHLCDDFFYDKDQIYYLGYYTLEESGRPVSQFGKVFGKNEGNRFGVGKSYCSINDQVFLRKEYKSQLLDLNASSTREYLIDSYYSTYLITDGKKVYINSLHYQGTDFTEIKGLSDLDLKPIIPNTSTWYYNPQNKMVYLHPDHKQISNLKREFGFLMYSNINDKTFIINRDGEFKTYNGILLPEGDGKVAKTFNSATDTDRLKSLEPYTLYNFNDVFYDALLKVYKENGIDNNLLTRLGETIFYTDGKNILWLNEAQHINNSFGEDETSQNGVLHIEHFFTNWVCRINNPDKLVIINNNMLTDGTTLYYIDYEGGDRKLKATSFSTLGLPVFFLEKGKNKIDD